MGEEAGREWTPADSALWHSLALLADRRAGRLPQQLAEVPFDLTEGEIALVTGPFAMDAMIAENGEYVNDPGQVFSARVLDPGAASGTAVDAAHEGAAIARPVDRPRWRPDFSGEITVTSHGFVLQTESGLHRWMWEDVEFAEVQAFTAVVMLGNSENGPLAWRLRSDWAELVFGLWAMAVDPAPAQLVDGSWLPRNWIRWAAGVGYPVSDEVVAAFA